MTNSSRTEQLWTYIAECVRLLYWAYFKPFTLERWLRDIHPDLRPDSHILEMRSEFGSNSRLDGYIRQVWWLNATIPVVTVLLVGSVYTLVSKEAFDWFASGLVLVGWWLVLSLRLLVTQIEKSLIIIFGISILIIYLWFISGPYTSDIIKEVLQLDGPLSNLVALQPALTQLWPLALGIVLSIIFGIEEITYFGTVIGIASYIVSGTLSYAITGIILGVATIIIVNKFAHFLDTRIILTYLSVNISVFSLEYTESLRRALLFLDTFLVGIGFFFGQVTWGLAIIIVILLLNINDILNVNIFLNYITLMAWTMTYILISRRIYFWLPELFWMNLLTRFTSSQQRAEMLGYLPHWYDELIHLPLPFVDRWIVEAYRTNPTIARQMITYLINSTNQQKVAAQAIVGIVVERLGHTQTVSDIVASRGELGWIPSPPPLEAGPVLPKLLEISQDVRAAKSATSAYRQRELLNKPIESLQNLTNELAFGESARWATTYGVIVQKWRAILETAQETLAEQALKISEISQTYVVGPALDPQRANSRFKGRDDLFREIESVALSDLPPILLLQGGRRTGKSSTLNYLPERLLASRFVPLVVDVQGIADASTLTGLADSLANQMMKMAKLSRDLTLPTPDFDALDKDPFPALRRWMDEVEQKVEGKRILLCLDEFERLEEVIRETGSRAPLNFLRHVMQHRRRWVLLFSSSHKLEELAPYWSDYLINTRALHISYLREEEARELIVKPVEDFPDIYEAETVDAIIQLTRGQPFLVQLVCQEIVERLNRAQRKRAVPEDVSAIVSIAIERASGYFLELWNNILNEEERVVLRGLVAGEQPSAEARRVVRRLVRKEVLEQKEGVYVFQVPLVEAFVREKVLDE